MDTALIAAIIGVIGGLFGTWVGSVISRKASHEAVESSNENATLVMQRQEFNKAAAEFRTAFVDYIYQIRHTENMDDYAIGFTGIRDKHIAIALEHEKAKIRLEPFIAKADRAGFEAAWENHRQWPEQFNKQDDKNDIQSTVLGHIYALLEFANPK